MSASVTHFLHDPQLRSLAGPADPLREHYDAAVVSAGEPSSRYVEDTRLRDFLRERPPLSPASRELATAASPVAGSAGCSG